MLTRVGRRAVASGSAVLAVLAAAGCSADGDSEPPGAQTPEGEPTLEEVVEFSELPFPDNAEDLTIERTVVDDLPRFDVVFATTPAAAQEFCEGAENFSLFRSPPTEEEAEDFGITEESIEGSATCRGAHPSDSTISRDAVVVFPDEETAVVHLRAEKIAQR